jgi:hypothetical protein
MESVWVPYGKRMAAGERCANGRAADPDPIGEGRMKAMTNPYDAAWVAREEAKRA